ncbi:MAG: methyltransferase [Pseudomonadota bacterium]|nr:methyltransferase [Pseudomonadota bacterium]
MISDPAATLHRSHPNLVPDHGSFRDRANRVYDDGRTIIRGINAEALRHWNDVSETAFFRELLESGKVVRTSVCSGEQFRVPDAEWSAYLTHERIPFVSYPYEWCFGMLKDAALLHLDILEQAIPQGWTLKDATAYNVQFVGARPVFIDIPSFTPYAKGEPWIGYRQFCMMFLYPLMLRAYCGIDYLPMLRGSLDGIDPETANQILSGSARFRKGVFGHVYLHAKMQARYRSQDLELAKRLTENAGGSVVEQKAGRHSEAMVLGMIQSLRRIVTRLETPESRTTWGDYETDHSYAESSFAAKKAFVERAVHARRRSLVWDVGCNTGTFSALAASGGAYVVAVDGDAKAIERLYQRQREAHAENILPLVMNLSSASPDQGWRGRERKALEKRGKPELILCLALIHHIVISANIPVSEFLDWLRDFDCEVVIEHVGLDDDMTLMLLRNRVNQYQDLGKAEFERLLTERFEIKAREPLKGGTREIFHVSPK